MKRSGPKAAQKASSYAAALWSMGCSLLVGLNPSPTPTGSCAQLPGSLVSLGTHKQVKGFIAFFL